MFKELKESASHWNKYELHSEGLAESIAAAHKLLAWHKRRNALNYNLGTWHDIMVAAQPNCHDIVERASALQLSCPAVQSPNVRTVMMSSSASCVGCCCLFTLRGFFSRQRPLLLRTDFLLEAP